ncbi:glucuronate isomerase [Paenibacillus lutimineralis]|uniref:Uronate isomerase n=1 Tax=Paenibacillus lutimineralis TaxID=2707005 RepID=A0A3Q9I9I4_9BACL|nr:glucuronate isomerase [Paenibacillus lutimineralis]AZS14206.1 glucuronate isomerase [Paenibacillus lutimineralis]
MFLNDDFLLTTPMARTLFHNHASKMPIIDYHCHLDPQEIYENKPFVNLTEAWLSGDHYKWRLMRANGVPETHITGDASDYDKFLAWARTVPKTIGNPLYSWTHLELRRFFGVDELLNEESVPRIWEEVNRKLSTESFKRRNIIKNAKVKMICTTDDPVDSLSYHQRLAEEEQDFKVLPTFRPDKALNIDAPGFKEWIGRLENTSGQSISSYVELVHALKNRVEFFHDNGCRLSDHALDVLRNKAGDAETLNSIFRKRIADEELSADEITIYRTELLAQLIAFYREKNWTMQLHMHAYRNNNTSMLKSLGPDTGYDALNDLPITEALAKLLDRAESEAGLPKTILYSLNPKDYPVLLTLMGCFQRETPGKLQLGSGWWFNDTRSGMRQQLSLFAEHSLLANFVGMLTDSRSFLSYTRHEYFRRVLCELIGEWVERGEAPEDPVLLGQMVEDISYNNAARYFGF